MTEKIHLGLCNFLKQCNLLAIPVFGNMPVYYEESARILSRNIVEKKYFEKFRFLLVLTESVDYGPVFVQEPDDIIFPTDSDEKKLALNCEARGSPVPNYR